MLQNIRQLCSPGFYSLEKEKDVQICVARLVLEMHYSFISSLLSISQLVSNIFTTPAILEFLSSRAGGGVSERLQRTKETEAGCLSLSLNDKKNTRKKENKMIR